MRGKITEKQIAAHAKNYWKRIRSIGISRQMGEDRGLLDYLTRILEKKNLLSTKTRKTIYRELGSQYAQIDHKEDAWRYLVLADGLDKARKIMQDWKNKWSQTYKNAFEDYRGY